MSWLYTKPDTGDFVRVTEITTGVGFDAHVTAMCNNDIQILPVGANACPVWVSRLRYDVTVKEGCSDPPSVEGRVIRGNY